MVIKLLQKLMNMRYKIDNGQENLYTCCKNYYGDDVNYLIALTAQMNRWDLLTSK